MRELTTTIVLLAAAITAVAQNVENARITGQPLQYMQDGKVAGCGLRFLVIRQANGPGVEVLDSSVNIYDNGRALVKAILYHAPSGDVSKRAPVALESFWFKAKGKQSTVPLSKPFTGEDKGALLYISEFNSAAEVLAPFTPIQISVRRAKSQYHTILSGTPELSDIERQQVSDCLEELIATMRASVDKQEAK